MIKAIIRLRAFSTSKNKTKEELMKKISRASRAKEIS